MLHILCGLYVCGYICFHWEKSVPQFCYYSSPDPLRIPSPFSRFIQLFPVPHSGYSAKKCTIRFVRSGCQLEVIGTVHLCFGGFTHWLLLCVCSIENGDGIWSRHPALAHLCTRNFFVKEIILLFTFFGGWWAYHPIKSCDGKNVCIWHSFTITTT